MTLQLHGRTSFFLVVLIGCCPLAFAEAVPGLQEIKEIYKTSIPSQIRKNFGRTLQTHHTCPECVLGVLKGEKFLAAYAKKFIVLGMAPNSFGGVWAVIAVEGEPKTAFRLWLYDVSDEEYELRSIEELPDFFEEELIRQIRSPAYRQYWL